MLSFNPQKKNCTGCAACYSACPVRCITMEVDEEGFLYPVANNTCIHCGMCESICPTFHEKQNNKYIQKAIAALSNDYHVWHRSASGGAFSEICRNWADNDTLIVGAAWDGLRVHHIGVVGFDSIEPLCKSKYVGSAIEDTFILIKDALKKKRKAIFCGCPCQVAGLKAFLNENYDNLLTIDLICHGHGSQIVFNECLNLISEHFGEKVIAYQFRAKRKQYEEDYICCITTERSQYYVVNDPYMQLFLSQNALRPSCGENCKYRDARRPGDLTIADFKGLTKMFSDQVFPKKNWSTVVSNTQKGEACMNSLRKTMDVRPITIQNVVEYNPLFAKQTWFSKDRDAFFVDFTNNPTESLKKWTKPFAQYKPNLLKWVLQNLPKWMKVFLYKCYIFIKDL